MDNLQETLKKHDNLKAPQGGYNSIEQIREDEKAKAFLALFDKARQEIQNQFHDLFEGYNVNFKPVAIAPERHEQLSEGFINAMNFNFLKGAEKPELNVTVSLNIEKFSQLPAIEAYTLIYAEMHNSCLSKRQEYANNSEAKFGKKDELDSKAPVSEEHKSIIDYLKDFVKAALGIEDKKYTNGYEFAVRNVANTFESEGVTANEMFGYPNSPNLANVQSLSAERYKNLKHRGLDEQSVYLAGVFSQEQFQSVTMCNEASIRDLCATYLAPYQITLNDVRVVFEPGASAGSFTDYGARGQEVSFDLKRLRARKNPTDVFLTVTHELTHAIDCVLSKREGLANHNGTGLRYNLVGSGKQGIKGILPLETCSENASKEEKNNSDMVVDFVKRLEQTCYLINPNEVSARAGEEVAIKYIQRVNTDPQMKASLQRSIDKLEDYKKDIVRAMENSTSLEGEYYGKIEAIVQNDATKKHIENRLGYIKELKNKGFLDKTKANEFLYPAQKDGSENALPEMPVEKEV